MKKNVLLIVMSLVLFSCKKEEKPEQKTIKKEEVKIQEIHKELYGIYTGDFFMEDTEENLNKYGEADFSTKKLSIKLTKITKDSVCGYSVVNGNQRKFRGTFDEKLSKFVLNEDGTDKSDGKFELKLKKDSLNGSWLAYQSKYVKSPEKKVLLRKRDFNYNPDFMLKKGNVEDYEEENPVDWENGKSKKQSYVDDEGKTQYYEITSYRSASNAVYKINASKEKLSEKQIKNLRKLDLEIIKNAIYARHGYSFKKQTYRNFFEYTDWYVPVSNNVDTELTPLEKENIALLTRFISYAEDHYDTFGR
jgi:hypothetical protein